ncbi:carbohydrate ABC transporter permease [Gemmiger sp.]|uniref:carbohydrate ABC transporter permease n=1 Tax=Gemmiger sp. TaxID=2049027 RepID=UPI003A8F680D
MSATAATKKQKPLKRHPSKLKQASAYTILAIILISIVAVLFAFPLYWIITGSFKTQVSINATTPEWWPSEWVATNYAKLFSRQKAPLWEFAVPFSSNFSKDGKDIIWWSGPQVPAAIRWLINTVFMAVASMILTCITSAMAGYALAKKRFVGRSVLFTLIVCAMALPKQVILIPLLREMSSLNLYNTIWAVIFPIVGWPFGVFLMKQFSEGIPGEMLEAARIDGASEATTFTRIALPIIKPGIGALAIFTFINSWNDYFMQLIMLSSTSKLTISLGIAKLQAENSTDYGLIMAGAALAAVPIIIVFLAFQKYFTKGITMGAVKG